MMLNKFSAQLFLIAIISTNGLCATTRSSNKLIKNEWARLSNIWLFETKLFVTHPATLPMVDKDELLRGFQINMSGDDIIFPDAELESQSACKLENGCKIGTEKSKVIVRGIELEVFTGSTKFNWMKKEGLNLEDIKFFSLVPTKDAKQNQNYPYPGRSIGFKPTSSLFTYLNKQLSSGSQQAIYFTLDYSAGLWDNSKFEAYMQRGRYVDNPGDFYIGNMPQLIATEKEGKEIISDPGKFLPIKDNKGFWTLDQVKFKFIAQKESATLTGEACFSDAYRNMVGVRGINEFWQQIYIDACGGKSYLDCKISFDPTKLPKIEITIDGVVLKLVGEDYMAWMWADNKPESKKLESSVRSINSFTFT